LIADLIPRRSEVLFGHIRVVQARPFVVSLPPVDIWIGGMASIASIACFTILGDSGVAGDSASARIWASATSSAATTLRTASVLPGDVDRQLALGSLQGPPGSHLDQPFDDLLRGTPRAA